MAPEELEKKLKETEKRLTEAERRITINEDIEQIKQLHIRYMNALTFVKWDDVIDCFAEDSSLDVQFGGLIKGKAKIARFFKEMLSQIHIGKEGIFAIHPQITVDGDRAKGNWLMYIMYADYRTWQSRYWIQGIYDAEYVRVKGNWKFSHLQWRPRLEPPGPPPPTMAP
jgi:ketosteroid isomerase-like protein